MLNIPNKNKKPQHYVILSLFSLIYLLHDHVRFPHQIAATATATTGSMPLIRDGDGKAFAGSRLPAHPVTAISTKVISTRPITGIPNPPTGNTSKAISTAPATGSSTTNGRKSCSNIRTTPFSRRPI